MPRRLGLLLILPLLACLAVVPTPAPFGTPLPLLTPKPLPTSILGAPTVVVFPFDVRGGLDPKVGAAIAQITASQIKASGGLNVLAVPKGVARKDFLKTARADHADYYISGYATPVGNEAAVVEQLVAVNSGIIIYSQTAQIATVADVASQSLIEREAILAHAGIGKQQVAPSAATPQPSAAAHGASVNIRGLSGLVDSVFGHHPGPAPKPSPTPIVKPSRGIIVTPVVGAHLSAADRSSATAVLFESLNATFKAQMTAIAGGPAQKASAMCGTDRDMTVAGGTLSSVPGPHHRTLAVFNFDVYTCFGAVLDHTVGKGATGAQAIRAAVKAYADAHPENS